ncbi:hypothetical protein [Minwuia thermotolerans]|uniref:Uncharacterized protein n=1 Tax=Minwuia thermotolerans TaxID=2056226 RepID=A0A2M9G6L3_9PROT|nr:hypothetical protein [Minwuia thermotolerans]PJK31358.1 hypothetical protein CVT23_01370 [Minwuia thermotolerans]
MELGVDAILVIAALAGVGLLCGFAVMRRRAARERRRQQELRSPEQQFRQIIEHFNRLDQSLGADNLPGGRG